MSNEHFKTVQEEIFLLNEKIRKLLFELDDKNAQCRSLMKAKERYEKLRRMNVPQFQDLYKKSIGADVPWRFDELVDELP